MEYESKLHPNTQREREREALKVDFVREALKVDFG
jgi:hypothetical protein